MEKITILCRTSKKNAKEVKLRFRVKDGKDKNGKIIDLFHKSEIVANLLQIAKLNPDGTKKAKTSCHDEKLFTQIQSEIAKVTEAYHLMKERNCELTSRKLEEVIANLENRIVEKSDIFLVRFKEYMEHQYATNVISEGRYKHYKVLYHVLERFLIIEQNLEIPFRKVDPDFIERFAYFMKNEHQYVATNRGLYTIVKESNVPTEERSQNYTSQQLKILRTFFRSLENKELISKSPFVKLDDGTRKKIMKQDYEEPVSLSIDEFQQVLNADVPETLKEVKRIFTLHCALGCRVGDFKKMSDENICVTREGIPYLEYVPEKTKEEGFLVQTPLVRFAFDTISQYGFGSPLLTYINGKSGYNKKIKELLKHCNIDRGCIVDKKTGKREPLYELASSKLGRKTLVTMMESAQIDEYAAGLHKDGSEAVKRYSYKSIRDRFVLMNLAFKQADYRVDQQLNIIEE